MEELLVDQIVMLIWRWKRLIRYEIAAIRMGSDEAFETWEKTEIARRSIEIPVYSSFLWERTSDLEDMPQELKTNLEALDQLSPS